MVWRAGRLGWRLNEPDRLPTSSDSRSVGTSPNRQTPSTARRSDGHSVESDAHRTASCLAWCSDRLGELADTIAATPPHTSSSDGIGIGSSPDGIRRDDHLTTGSDRRRLVTAAHNPASSLTRGIDSGSLSIGAARLVGPSRLSAGGIRDSLESCPDASTPRLASISHSLRFGSHPARLIGSRRLATNGYGQRLEPHRLAPTSRLTIVGDSSGQREDTDRHDSDAHIATSRDEHSHRPDTDRHRIDRRIPTQNQGDTLRRLERRRPRRQLPRDDTRRRTLRHDDLHRRIGAHHC